VLSSRNAGGTIPGFEGLSGHGRAAQMKHEADVKTALIILCDIPNEMLYEIEWPLRRRCNARTLTCRVHHLVGMN
jgi:hypothetical protein